MVGLNIDGLSYPVRVELDDSLPEKAPFCRALPGSRSASRRIPAYPHRRIAAFEVNNGYLASSWNGS